MTPCMNVIHERCHRFQCEISHLTAIVLNSTSSVLTFRVPLLSCDFACYSNTFLPVVKLSQHQRRRPSESLAPNVFITHFTHVVEKGLSAGDTLVLKIAYALIAARSPSCPVDYPPKQFCTSTEYSPPGKPKVGLMIYMNRPSIILMSDGYM